MNTYAPHIIGFMMLPWVEDSLRDPKRDKVEEEEGNQVPESKIKQLYLDGIKAGTLTESPAVKHVIAHLEKTWK
jgi:hypothetical protein